MKKREHLVLKLRLIIIISLILFLSVLPVLLPVSYAAEEPAILADNAAANTLNEETKSNALSDISMPALFAEKDKYNVNIILRDLTTNKPIKNMFVTYTIDGISSTIYVDTTSTIPLILKQGTHTFKIEADDKNTTVPDYYGTQKFDVESNSTQFINLYPVGLLRGFVKDKLDNIIPYADLKFECITSVIIEVPAHTDKFGFFKVENSPIGTCKILANYEDGIGITEVEVKQGELSDITINIDKTLVKKGTNPWRIVSIILVVLLVVGYGGYILYNIVYKKYQSKLKSNSSKQTSKLKASVSAKKLKESSKSSNVFVEPLNHKTEASSDSKVSEAILKTLNSKEKAIVEFLLSNSNKASQAQIRHNTSIPRTSLTRVLQSLEAKKIINIERQGKMVKVELTDFFLGK